MDHRHKCKTKSVKLLEKNKTKFSQPLVRQECQASPKRHKLWKKRTDTSCVITIKHRALKSSALWQPRGMEWSGGWEGGSGGGDICSCLCAPSCLTPRDRMACSLPGSSVHGTLQARILEQVAISSSRGSSPPRDWTHNSFVSCIGRWILYHWATWETRTYVYLWLTSVDVWQKPIEYCNVIILQLKINLKN